MLFLLRVLAGAEPWVDGSRREASWELKRCAAAAAQQAQQLLTDVRRSAAGQTVEQAAEQAAGDASAAAAGATVPAAPAVAEGEAGAGGEGAAAPGGRKQAAKARMQARMRAQQAKAAAALFDEEEGGKAGGLSQGVSPAGQQAEAAAQPAEQQPAVSMDIDASGAAAAADAMATDAATGAGGPRAALPAHHPAAWEQQAGAECALCHGGSEVAPLGLVAQLAVTELPCMAAADPPSPLTPQHPGVCGGALGAPGDDEAEAGVVVQPFPAPGAGPGLSTFDRQPSLHLLCCRYVERMLVFTVL